MPIPRPEYPRPDLRRPDWRNLNGLWDFATDDADVGLAHGWHERGPFDRQILVPYPFESPLSGIGDPSSHPVIWYRRTFPAEPPPGGRLLLHFGAVDYQATVWLNGRELGRHQGGYTPFSFDLTGHLRPGENTLVLRAVDTLSIDQPRGKQYWQETPSGIWYSRTSGIWQTVWLEPVPASFVRRLRLTPHLAEGAIEVDVEIDGDADRLAVQAVALELGQEIAREAGPPGQRHLLLRLPEPRPWSPQSPHLYGLQVTLLADGRPVDRVDSYFGLRQVSVEGRNILLNGHPLYQRLVLDQGYWPGGQYAAPSDDALRADVLWARRLGFNGARKHQKIEDPRWLYWCDRLGLLVWGEMPGCGLFHYSPQAMANVRLEWPQVLARDHNHPCIIAWVPFNESWGIWGVRDSRPVQAEVREVVEMTRRRDPTRLVVDNSGWEHLDTDIADVHTYLRTGEQVRVWWPCYRDGQTYVYDSGHPFWAGGYHYAGQPVIISEYGGMAVEGYGPPPGKRLQAVGVDAPARYLERYRDLTQAILELEEVSGYCFTQLTDVEGEVNGLLTYDRRPKVDPDEIAAANRQAPAHYPIREPLAARPC